MEDIYKELEEITGLDKLEIDRVLGENTTEIVKEDRIYKTPKKVWKVLEFQMPIASTVTEAGKMRIMGTAINEVTTRNKVKYIADELEKAAPTFRNVPILLDHSNKVKDIVGRSTDNVRWNPQARAIEFEADIMDEKIQSMINDGRIDTVSIGAQVEDLQEQEDGSMLATGIRGLELSLVAVGGDPNANIAMAMAESFDVKKKLEAEKIKEKVILEKSPIWISDWSKINEVDKKKFQARNKRARALNPEKYDEFMKCHTMAQELIENPKAKLSVRLK